MDAPLFRAGAPSRTAPLAERMRPRRLDEIVGQKHLLSEGGFLRAAIARRELPSLILFGPPGCGKTTLARLLAAELGIRFHQLSAVESGVKDVRRVAEEARALRAQELRSLLFLDEIHRFHRGQQDALLPHVEDGTLILVGATTENPAHSVVTPLLSRCRLLALEALAEEDIAALLARALGERARGLGNLPLEAEDAVLAAIAAESAGDARRGLSTLEIAAQRALARVEDGATARIELEDVREAAQQRFLHADRRGDAHYDLASAFIKSLRGSDPDAAVYYLMRLVEGGEDPRFLTRRMMIFAAEDIGIADPRSLEVAVAAAEAYERIGLPEGTLPLTQAAIYLSLAPKSGAVIAARDAAREAVHRQGSLPVPAFLRDAHGGAAKSLGIGRDYVNPHSTPEEHVPVDHLPERLHGTRFYRPGEQGAETRAGARLSWLRARVDEARRGRKS